MRSTTQQRRGLGAPHGDALLNDALPKAASGSCLGQPARRTSSNILLSITTLHMMEASEAAIFRGQSVVAHRAVAKHGSTAVQVLSFGQSAISYHAQSPHNGRVKVMAEDLCKTLPCKKQVW